jgi:hypothetical protein
VSNQVEMLTIQKKQAKYFAFRREKAPVESGLKIYDAASQRHAFKTKNFFMQDKKIFCGPRSIINSVVIT